MPNALTLQDSDGHILCNTNSNGTIYHVQAALGFYEPFVMLGELFRLLRLLTIKQVQPCSPLTELIDENCGLECEDKEGDHGRSTVED